MSTLIFTNLVSEALDNVVAQRKPSKVFIHVDSNTAKFVMPILRLESKVVADATIIESPTGDHNKSLESLDKVWKQLCEGGATRSGMFINVGGGVISDLGGFAAATFKRGMTVVNIPTTLLAAVDASVGGKTGINYQGLKNQIGVFNDPDTVIISTIFFETLTKSEMLSGYAEMIKHALLKDEKTLADVLRYKVTLPTVNPDALLELLQENVLIKKQIVDADPTEQGLRKVLNLGHTIAHAFEAFAMNDRRQAAIPHGFAVAQGLVVEAILSNMIEGFSSDTLHTLAAYIKDNYGPFMFTCDDYDKLLGYMRHDKKNDSPDQINFTLLKRPGDPVINVVVPDEQIKAALDIYRDLMGI